MTDEPGSVLAGNCAALAVRNPHLAALILSSRPDPSIHVVSARSGALVPVIRQQGGDVPLHSRYDPVLEAERLAPEWEGAGCLVVFGLGGGYHVASMLGHRRVASLIVVEKDAAVLRALFELLPFQDLLSDRRAWFLAGTGGLRECLGELWQPALMGGLRTFALRPWCARERSFCDEAARAVASAVDAARADYSVQAHFGKRWFTNMLQNMEAAEASPAPRRIDAARVTAAGPSLDRQLDRLHDARAEGPLFAVDTSLPALMRAGITPDAVVSIDCQVYGYLHFFQGMPREAVLYLDLASPPFLARRRPVGFTGGGHPFAAYLSTRWRRFPVLDTSGGNVTHGAVSLALTLGAREVTVYGADFSYPAGKPYARGTYLYDLFGASASRPFPAESRFYSFLFRTDDVVGTRAGAHLRYTTALLSAYRDRFQAMMDASRSRIVTVTGDGLPLKPAVPVGKDAGEAPAGAATPGCGWREFLGQYATTLARLPRLDDPPWSSLEALDTPEREAWGTLLPIAARVARESADTVSQAAALETARNWALARVRRQCQA